MLAYVAAVATLSATARTELASEGAVNPAFIAVRNSPRIAMSAVASWVASLTPAVSGLFWSAFAASSRSAAVKPVLASVMSNRFCP